VVGNRRFGGRDASIFGVELLGKRDVFTALFHTQIYAGCVIFVVASVF